jgi:hypothetical protein
MKLSQLLHGLATDLNDAELGYEFQTWTKQQLLGWFNEGRCNAFTLNPSKFSETRCYKLDTGSDQQLCGCTMLHKILGVSDAQCIGTTPIPRSDSDLALRWSKKGCAPAVADGFKIKSYTFDPLEGGQFHVTPPVPPNEEVWVKTVCNIEPEALTLDGDPEVGSCQTTNAAKQWALFRALMVDDESDSSLKAAIVHRDMFFQLMGVQVTSDLINALGQGTPTLRSRSGSSR